MGTVPSVPRGNHELEGLRLYGLSVRFVYFHHLLSLLARDSRLVPGGGTLTDLAMLL